MSINPKTLGVGKEGGYLRPDYEYIQQKEYSYEEICELGRQAFKVGDEGTWDGIFWATQGIKKFSSERLAVKAYAKEVNKSVRWVQRGLQVYKRLAHLRGKFPELYFEHFRHAIVEKDDAEAEKWLARAADNGWSGNRLYKEMSEVGAYPKERYKPVGVYRGKVEDAEDGIRLYGDEYDQVNTVIENVLDKFKGKEIEIIIRVKEEETAKKESEENADGEPGE